MSTIRVERRDRFTTVDRRAVNDQRLSFRARGVLIWLLDKPNGWRVDSKSIAASTREGRDAIRTALRELEECGYITRERMRAERGRWITETVVREIPSGAWESGVGGPGVGKPGANTNTETEDCYPPTPRRRRSGCAPAKREWRVYDEEPMSPEAIMEKYGVQG